MDDSKSKTPPRQAVVVKDENGITTSYVGDDHCPYCGAELTMATDTHGEGNIPEPGSLMLCSKCVQVCRLDQELRLEKMPVEEYLSIPSEEREEIERVRRAMRAFNKLKAEQATN